MVTVCAVPAAFLIIFNLILINNNKCRYIKYGNINKDTTVTVSRFIACMVIAHQVADY